MPIKNARGEKTSTIGTLEVDKLYGKNKMDSWQR